MDYQGNEKRITVSKILKYLNERAEVSKIDFVQHINLFMKREYQTNKGSEFIVASNCYESIDKTFSKDELDQFLDAVTNPIFRKLMNKIPQFINEFESKMNQFKKTA